MKGCLVLSAMGYMTEQVDAHNEVTLITLCRDLKAVTVPFEGKLSYNKHKSFLFFPSIFFLHSFPSFSFFLLFNRKTEVRSNPATRKFIRI